MDSELVFVTQVFIIHLKAAFKVLLALPTVLVKLMAHANAMQV
jgi:hypothetical protein